MIIGVGTDVLYKRRVERVFQNCGDRFLKKLLAESEYCTTSSMDNSTLIDFLSKRFSAKESVAKAIGSGIGKLLSLKDIEIIKSPVNAKYVRPTVAVNDKITIATIITNKAIFNVDKGISFLLNTGGLKINDISEWLANSDYKDKFYEMDVKSNGTKEISVVKEVATASSMDSNRDVRTDDVYLRSCYVSDMNDMDGKYNCQTKYCNQVGDLYKLLVSSYSVCFEGKLDIGGNIGKIYKKIKEGIRIHLSISDERDIVQTFAILELVMNGE